MLGPRIDLNADVGERGDLLESDLALLDLVSSANIACGGHAGSDELMLAMLRRGADRGLSLGAHPGYADREGFGRRAVELSPAELAALGRSQVGRLARLAAGLGLTLSHVKPHGALYHRLMQDASAAEAFAEGCLHALAEVTGDPFAGVLFVGLPESPGLACWQAMGLEVACEGFADRRYDDTGRLLPREDPLAVIEDPDQAGAQALRLVQTGRFDTLCLHGDTPGALRLAGAVRRVLLEGGVRVVGLSQRGG